MGGVGAIMEASCVVPRHNEIFIYYINLFMKCCVLYINPQTEFLFEILKILLRD